MTGGAARGAARRRLLLAILVVWIACAGFQLATHRAQIAARAYPDPDDVLRLVEVRDWLGGQAFRDVSQHRMNPPAGAPMHWSRLVDMPIAGVELALRPALGVPLAETVAAVIVPLATMGVVMLATALVAEALAGPAVALVAAAMAGLSPAAIVQLQPLRVDHHGWEIAWSMLATAALLGRPSRRAGAAAGVALAIGLQISLEPLPFAVALGAAAALRYCIDPTPARRATFVAFTTSLAAAEALLFVALHAAGDRGGWCDAVTLPHVAALVVVAVGAALVVRIAPATQAGRLGGLAATGAVALALFRAVPPHCGLDGFAMLEPIVRTHWYDRVAEGLPLWRSGAAVTAALLGVPIVGTAAAAIAAGRAGEGRRGDWVALAALTVAATAIGLLVMRAMVFANVIALPAVAWAMMATLRRTTASANAGVRVIGGAGAVLALNPFAPAILAAAVVPSRPTKAAPTVDCLAPSALAPLDRLPPARLFAALDSGPAILFATRHAVLASGHHRNHAAMAAEIAAWIGSDAAAERLLRARGFGYVLVCPASSELGRYAKDAPTGFAAHLIAGRAPAWLASVPLGSSPLRLWRVMPQPPAGPPSSRSAGGSVPTAAQMSRNADFSPSS